MNCMSEQKVFQMNVHLRARDAHAPSSLHTEQALPDIPARCLEVSSVLKITAQN